MYYSLDYLSSTIITILPHILYYIAVQAAEWKKILLLINLL